MPFRVEPQSAMPRVVLVVNHPHRDLPGLIPLALRLSAAGVVCLLTPFDLADQEIWRLAPDFVLLPYFRHYAKRSYQQMANAGIALGVLNTEGGVVESLDKYADLLVREKRLRAKVACYCCWGPKVAKYLVEQNWFESHQCVLTGCPRTDFYAPAWREATRGCADYVMPYAKNLVLINGANPIANPGLVSPAEQIRQLARFYRMSLDEARRWQDRDAEGLRQLTALANTLAQRFPQATFVYRPHPFERLETYQEYLEPHKNLHCVREGSVDAWILQAKAVIQRGCSTSVEARMAGVPAFMPRWISVSVPRPAAEGTSLAFDTPDDLARALDAVLAGTLQIPQHVQQHHDALIQDWFFRIDGLAHQRVAQTILSNLPKHGRTRRERNCRRHANGSTLAGPLSRKWWKAQIANSFEKLGLPHHQSLAHWKTESVLSTRLAAWDHCPKHFDRDQVRRLILAVVRSEAARQEGLHQSVHVELASADAAAGFGPMPSRTVVVAPAVQEGRGAWSEGRRANDAA